MAQERGELLPAVQRQGSHVGGAQCFEQGGDLFDKRHGTPLVYQARCNASHRDALS
jgi:hypothetical protein